MTENMEGKILYEIGLLINGELTEEEARGVKTSIEELLVKHGTISEQGELVLHTLAYRIAKRKTAYFSWIRFEAPASAVGEIKEGLRYTKNLVRTLILKLNKKHLDQETRYTRRSADYVKNKEVAKATKEEPAPQKEVVSGSTPLPHSGRGSLQESGTTSEVDVQELDKRLAEIL